MNILYMVVTPYHVKMSNYIASTMYKNQNNMIIATDMKHTKCDILYEFIDKNYFNKIEKYDYNIKIKEIIKSFKSSKKYLNNELENMNKAIDEFNPDVIIYFIDHEPVYQIVLSSFNAKKIIVEEGLGIYAEDKKISIKEWVIYLLNKLIYRRYKFKLVSLGKSGLEDAVYAREPELTNTINGLGMKISKDEYRKIFYKENDDLLNLELNSNLFCPSLINYNIKTAKLIYEDIFKDYFENKKILYIKLHPAEVNINWIKSLSNKYRPYIRLIENKSITSDDLIMSDSIKSIISDYSSILINAPYMREDLELITCLDIMQSKYNIDINFKSKIFREFINKGVIKTYKGCSVNI